VEARFAFIRKSRKRGGPRAKSPSPTHVQEAGCAMRRRRGLRRTHNSKHSDDPRARSIHNAVLRQSSVV
jgi:hypothetical protein